MKEMVFKGVATALITPFNKDGIDFEAFDRIIEQQIAGGVNALVICGTTGEKATLNDEEHVSVLRRAVKTSNGRIPIIAGTGSNDTAHAVWMTRKLVPLAVTVCLYAHLITTRPLRTVLLRCSMLLQMLLQSLLFSITSHPEQALQSSLKHTYLWQSIQ